MHTTFINYKLPYWKTLDSEYFLTMNLQQCMVYQLEMVCQDFFGKETNYSKLIKKFS